jgi:uncharacterized protein (TIGR03000 family)
MFRIIRSTAIAALVGTTLLLTPGASDAQRGGGGGGRGGGGGGGGGGRGGSWNGGRGGENRGWYGGGGYGLGFGLGYGGWGYGWGGSPYYGGWNSPGYDYDYDTPAYGGQPLTLPRNSYYPSQSGNYPGVQTQLVNPNDAGFILRVPDPNAEVWFQDYKTQQRGTVRYYESSALEPNHTYTFSIRVRWVQNGQQMDQTRQVQGQAGQNATVDFTTVAHEQIPTRPRIINTPSNTREPTIVLPNQQVIPAPGNQPPTAVPQQIPTAPRKGVPLNAPSQEAPPQ